MRYLARPILAMALLAAASAMAADDTKYHLHVRLAGSIGGLPGTGGGENEGGGTGPGATEPEVPDGSHLPDPVYGDFTVTPTILDFGAVGVGNSKTMAVTVKNTAKKPLALGPQSYGLDEPFSKTSDCPEILGADMSCTIEFTYSPPSNGVYNKLYAASSVNLGQRYVELLGIEGGTAKLEFVSAPTPPTSGHHVYFFEDIPHLQTSTAHWTMKNTGAGKSGLITLSGASATYPMRTITGSCQNHPGLEPGETCDFTYTFIAAGGIGSAGMLSAVYEKGYLNKRIDLPMRFSVNFPLTPNFETLDFGNVPVGSTVSRTMTLTNPNSMAVSAASSMFTTGSPAHTVSGACDSIPAYSSCTITVSFKPTEARSYTSGSLEYNYGPTNYLQFAFFRGNGV